jgi:hypothetical protein
MSVDFPSQDCSFRQNAAHSLGCAVEIERLGWKLNDEGIFFVRQSDSSGTGNIRSRILPKISDGSRRIEVGYPW